jgi:hypothetical protein
LYGVHHTLEQKIINTLTVSRSATLLFDYQATKRWLTLMATESTKGTKPKVIKFIIPILAWGVRSLPEDFNSGSSGGSELSAKQRHDMDSNGLSRSEATANPRW